MTADGQPWEAALSIGGSGHNEKHHQQSRGKWNPTLGHGEAVQVKDLRQTHMMYTSMSTHVCIYRDMHICIHTYIDTCADAHMHTWCAHKYIYTYIHKSTHVQIDVHVRMDEQMYMHIRIYRHICMYVYTYTHIYTHMCTETLMSTCIHTETLMHVYMPIYKCMYIYTDTCHIYTDIQACTRQMHVIYTLLNI